jgi:hypothetical protein
MRVAVLDAPGPVENLHIRELVGTPRLPDTPSEVLQAYLDRLAAGTTSLGPIQVHRRDDIRAAHTDLESNRTFGKQIVLTEAQSGVPVGSLRP